MALTGIELALTGIELRQVTPGLAGRFIEELPGSDPTRNLALAALRHFFDTLVTRHAVALNSFSSITALLRPCCMDHPEGCLIIVFFNTGDNLDAT